MPDEVMHVRQTAAATTDDAARSPRVSPRVVRTLVILLAAIALLVPIWTVRYPSIVDYPNHLASTFVLFHLKDPALHFSRFYSTDWGPNPYLIMYWILLGLQWLVPIGVAGRLLLSLCAISVPAAAWFFLRRASPGQDALALWSLLIAENLFFFLYGMINIQLSLALCFVVLGVWLDFLAKPRMSLWLLLLSLTTLLYFSHLVGFGIAGLVMTAYVLLSRQRLSRLVLSGLLFVPGAILYLYLHLHLHHASHPGPAWALQFRGPIAKIEGLLSVMIGAYPALDFLTAAVLLLSLFLALSRNREFSWNRPWLGVTGLLFALYCIFPARYGPGYNADRALLPFIFILGLSVARLGRRTRELAAIAMILFLVRAATLEHKFVSQQPGWARMAMSFDAIPRNARVLPLVGSGRGGLQSEEGFWAYGVIERGWFSPCLFHDPGVEPLQITPPIYGAACGPAPGDSAAVDWDRVASDYSYVWALDVPQFTARLAAIGKPVFQSGNLRVYRISAGSPGP